MKVTELASATPSVTQKFMEDNDLTGLRQLSGEDLGFLMMEAIGGSSSITHRLQFRGKNLGGTYTVSQRTAVSNGKFNDLWLGDYWITDGFYPFRIVDIDYWYNMPNAPGTTSGTYGRHHLVIVPDRYAFSTVGRVVYSTTPLTTYYESNVRSVINNTSNWAGTVTTIFGNSYVIRHPFIAPQSYTEINGEYTPISYGHYMESMSLMTEQQVHGTSRWTMHYGAMPDSGWGAYLTYRPGLGYSDAIRQFALYSMHPRYISNAPALLSYAGYRTGFEGFWLRDAVRYIGANAAYYALGGYGGACAVRDDYYGTSSQPSVYTYATNNAAYNSTKYPKPCFAIGG